MFLSRLDIFGFKSFYQKVNLNFHQGITSIVGPNGCGKSNVIDSIRWVLGEQRASVLRNDKMEGVIFNGTKRLKPLGMAEVSLTVENVKGTLKTDFSEVTITRRLYRSGESEYLLNKTICRLKDIIELFMDSGMGFNAYSIIELKMIELILNDKTNERRKMFEEAAGVTKYKQRRTAALKKLEAVRQDLTRVTDIVSEVEKVVRSLERQAKKAEQYTQLTEELKMLEIDLLEREYNDIKKALEPLKRKIEESKLSKMVIDGKLSRDESGYEALRSELMEYENKVNTARQNLAENNNDIKKVEHNIILQKERLKSLRDSIVRYENENNTLAEEITSLKSLIERDDELILKIEKEINEVEERYKIIDADLNAQNEAYNRKSAEIKENTERKFLLINQISEIKNKQENIKSNVENLENRSVNYDDEVEISREEFNNCDESINKLSAEISGLLQNSEKLEQEYHRKENDKRDIQVEIDELQQKSFEIQSDIGKDISKMDFLKSLIEKNIGVSDSVQFLTRKANWLSRPVITIAEAVNSEAKYRIAVEAALGDFSNYILVETLEEANSGIEILKKSNHGKATFICMEMINKLPIENVSQSSSLKAVDIIKCENEYKHLFEFIFKNVFIFDDIKSASSFAKENRNTLAVTLEGEIFGGNGIIRGGSKRSDEGMLIGKKEQLRELLEKVEGMRKLLDENQEFLKIKNREFDSINLKELFNNVSRAKSALNDVEKKKLELEVKKGNLLGNLERLSEEKRKLDREKQSLSSELVGFSPNLKDNEFELLEVEEFLKILNGDFIELENRKNLKSKELNDINIELVSKKGEAQNLQNEVERALNTVENVEKKIERHNSDIKEFNANINSIEEDIIEEENRLSELLTNNSLLQKERDEAQNIYSRKREDVDAIEKVIKEERKIHEKSLNELSDMEIKFNELKLKAENLQLKAQDEFQLEIQSKLFENIDTFSYTEAKDRVKIIKEKINSVGPVNLLAFSEYQTEKERMDFLTHQRDDLLESEKTLLDTIEEINTTAKQKFDETFEQIRTNFISVFKTLFDEGDEADLRFREDLDPLEGEVEIIAKPKGKRPISIESLSGGEKTLTAISLLFAIYLVKPSPFCILDEVDAPLDDANIDRFVKILRRFSDKTQFIVVTHNKRTMEAADTMYGVTMEEEGVSKVVSVRFNEDFALKN
jgi:chromosome segregation protein